jgi:type IV conjugative transfer system coupling protein TraD
VYVAPDSKKNTITQSFSPIIGKPYERKSITILKDMEIKFDVFRLKNRLAENAIYAGMWAGGCFVIFIGGWTIIGNRHRKKKHERGSEIISPEILNQLLKKQKKASDLKIGALSLVKDKETSHILVAGTTGAGKSNLFNIMLPQIRKRGDKAVIIDLTGEYVAKFYNPRTDVILNPFDTRSKEWDVWAECKTHEQLDALAASLIPDSKHQDPFWIQNSRTLFIAAVTKLIQESKEDKRPSNKDLLDKLLKIKLQEAEIFFNGTLASSLMTASNEKTSISLRATLSSYLKSLRYLEDASDPFSIRHWMKDEQKSGWLFITSRSEQKESVKPLLSCWMDTAINALTNLEVKPERRVWFILDELASLNRLPSLTTVLAEGRKYGACVMVGIQSLSQINEIYGNDAAQTILNLFNSRIFFRTPDTTTATWISKALGEAEYKESVENLSYGAHEMRDGVSISQVTRTKPLVMPTEIGNLHDLEAYIHWSTLPVTRIKMQFKVIDKTSMPFIDKEVALLKQKTVSSAEVNVIEEESEDGGENMPRQQFSNIEREDQL